MAEADHVPSAVYHRFKTEESQVKVFSAYAKQHWNVSGVCLFRKNKIKYGTQTHPCRMSSILPQLADVVWFQASGILDGTNGRRDT